jgi:hypothetical protein
MKSLSNISSSPFWAFAAVMYLANVTQLELSFTLLSRKLRFECHLRRKARVGQYFPIADELIMSCIECIEWCVKG